jgi:processive 1,2-diacylglycerol beta-glucosyltransferase
VLVTYATAGAGHRRAAEAVAQAVRAARSDVEVHCLDVLDYTPPWFRSGYPLLYLFLVRRLSWLWRAGYGWLDTGPVFGMIRPLRRLWNAGVTGRFVAWLRQHPPDVVIVTHFLPVEVCSAGKRAGWLASRLVVVVTDWHPHRLWITRDAELTMVSSPESARVCEARGLSRSALRVTGIPIGAGFQGAAVDRETARRRYRLEPGRRTVLVTGGGTTVGRFEEVVVSLLALERRHPGRLQLLVVCGQNEGARMRIDRLARESAMPAAVFGFVETMDELMAASDLLVTKAGGLTISEGLGSALPAVLYHVIPGQERMNAEYVVRHGAGVMARGTRDVGEAVLRLADDPHAFERMRAAAKSLGRPEAARTIASEALQLAGHGHAAR